MGLTPEQVADNLKNIATETANNAYEVKSAEQNARMTEIEKTSTQLGEDLIETKNANVELQRQVDEHRVNMEVKAAADAVPDAPKTSLRTSMEHVIENKSDILAGKMFEFEVKALSYGSDDGANVPLEQRIEEIKLDPHFQNRVRKYVTMMPASGKDKIRFNRRTDVGTNPAATKAQGAEFADYSPTLTNIEETVRTFGVVTTINEEQLTDVLGLETFFKTDMMEFVYDLEDHLILNGSGAGTEWSGIFTEGIAWVDQREASETAIIGANLFDVLTNGIGQLAKDNYMPSKIWLNPADFYSKNFALAKSTQGEYVLHQVQNGLVPVLYGAQIIVTPAVTAGKFAITDNKAFAYHIGEGLEVEMYRNGDDFKNNAVTIRAKMRATLTNYLPNGIVQGDISTAIGQLVATQG